ncbi:probable ATP-dependent RNA helicase DDX31 [Corythoichthys intestinalis]|uniref:probable ATP-dependent RNA helicase DDX31 n=1 Tax=Corythoichthys intestinalis TaxID=161448 RepID=UPI0025A55166|nr:probable ATP-dependent RNA helicase DDX31 [Corythoichthys intestinalis]XP_061804490.1 probable ATP-dependent RNA helicase DDX31 [Nerophis lumbriciformis]
MSSSDDQLCINVTSCSPLRDVPDGKRRKEFKKARTQKAELRARAPPPSRMQTDDGTGVKTSSLFKHNPDIPAVQRPQVCPVSEKIFTSESFSDLNLHPHLVATLNKVFNVSTLTSVQKQSIPALLLGRDAVVRSQTGSGKTLSFAIPLVQTLQALPNKIQRSDGPLAVVVVPTRELALQTFATFQKLLKPFTWIVPGVLMGGEKRKSEKARLRKGINILVSTPGRLVDHIKNTLSIAFSAVRWLILDEADRTLDLGFEKDLTIILNALNSAGTKRQNVLLSATLTQGVTHLADICLKDPIKVQLSEPSAVGPSESFAVPTELKHFVALVPSKIRLVCLAAFLLHDCRDKKAMVFVSSCEEVDFLYSLFCGVLSANRRAGLCFLRLHGNMPQEERSEVFQKFCEDSRGVLLCTDVAARGLDLPQVTWIVQYTPPCSLSEYVHRAGRTARMGSGGSSLLFLTPGESAFVDELAAGDIGLSELKLDDILARLAEDDAYERQSRGRGQTRRGPPEEEARVRATVLQTHFENFVHADATSLRNAKKALGSYLRSYASYPARLKHVFHIRALHLGHAAKSFGLRDAPKGLAACAGPPRGARDADRRRPAKRSRAKTKNDADEFSSGVVIKKKRRQQAAAEKMAEK